MPAEDPNIPANYCGECRLVHPPMVTCYQASAEAMAKMLLRIGHQDQCRGCLVPIYWVTHLNGKKTPYTEAGLNHFIDCPQREMFRTKGKTS
jgi:hypothetical protein